MTVSGRVRAREDGDWVARLVSSQLNFNPTFTLHLLAQIGKWYRDFSQQVTRPDMACLETPLQTDTNRWPWRAMAKLFVYFVMKVVLFGTQDISRTECWISVIPTPLWVSWVHLASQSLQMTKMEAGFAAPSPMAKPNVNISEQSTLLTFLHSRDF